MNFENTGGMVYSPNTFIAEYRMYAAMTNSIIRLKSPFRPPIFMPIDSPQFGHVSVLMLISYPHSVHLDVFMTHSIRPRAGAISLG
jgi:hypothetical protein